MQFYYKRGLARADLGRVEDAIADIEKAIAAENDVLSDLTNRMRQALVLQYRQAADAKLTRGEALRQAMMVLLDGKGFEVQGKTLFTYGHSIVLAAVYDHRRRRQQRKSVAWSGAAVRFADPVVSFRREPIYSF